jgi:hypothetical protein
LDDVALCEVRQLCAYPSLTGPSNHRHTPCERLGVGSLKMSSLSKTLRDFVPAMVAVGALLGIVFFFNDRLRQTITGFSGDFNDVRASGPVASFGDAIMGVFVIIKDFGATNPFLFGFLLVSLILVVLMLRS